MLGILPLALGEGRSLVFIAMQHERGLPISQARNKANFGLIKIKAIKPARVAP
jgi:hypothetical protein